MGRGALRSLTALAMRRRCGPARHRRLLEGYGLAERACKAVAWLADVCLRASEKAVRRGEKLKAANTRVKLASKEAWFEGWQAGFRSCNIDV